MQALVIGHDHVAGIEHVGDELIRRGYELTWWHVVPEGRFTEPDVAVDFPTPIEWDLVVTLGAPWPRDRITRWVGDEVDFLAAARAAGSAVLGICFGAQLLGEALGARTVALPSPRIGWRQVTPRVEEIAAGPWFQWHAEQLSVPVDAEVLAESSDGVEAFRSGRCVAVQFHPEMTPALLERWLSLPGGSPEGLDLRGLRADTERHAPHAAQATSRLLDLVDIPTVR